MCCVNCRHCDEPVVGWPDLSEPDPVATQPLPDPAFRGPDPWKQPAHGEPGHVQPDAPDGVGKVTWLGPTVPRDWDAWYQKLADNKPPKVLPRSYLKWLAVDLDGTLAEGIWTPEEPTSEIGDPIGQNVVKVRRLAEAGWKIVIHTARPWHDYESIEAWANHYKVPFSRIVCGKLLAAAYIDDRAIDAADEDWTPQFARTPGGRDA